MTKLAALLFTAALGTAAAGSAALAAPKPPALDDQVHCALVFGEVTRQQNNGTAGAGRFPAMAKSGREFFVRTGARTLDDKAVTLETIEAYFLTRLGVLQDGLAKSPDAAAALDREYAACLPQFAAVAPEFAPGQR